MDPASLSIMLHNLIPIIAILSVFGAPVGFFWVSKNHKLRMKELEVDSQRMSQGSEQRFRALEDRLANLEAALGGKPSLPSAQERAALLEGPPDASRLRTR